MKVSLEDVSQVEKNVNVTIDKEEVAAEYNRLLLEVQKKAMIKGFRKGKAPRSHIEKLYGHKIMEDLVDNLIKLSFKDALDENNLKPITQPRIKFDDISTDADFVYSMNVELFPEFEVAGYEGFDLTRKKVAVEESDVEDTIKRLQEQHAVFKETPEEKQVADTDMVIFDFEGTLSSGELIKDGKQENFSVVIGSKNLIPGFEDNLIGLKKGGEKEFVLTFPEEYFDKEYAGADVKFHVRVREIKEKELPVVDDNFAKDLGEYETLDDLRKFVKEQLLKERERQSKLNIQEQIIDRLLELNRFDVPSSFIEKQLNYIIEESKRRQGITGDDERVKALEADIRENSRELAGKMVRKELILSRIIEKEGMTAADSEVEEKYAELAAGLNKPVDQVKDYYRKIRAEQFLKDEICTQKLFLKIIEKAQVKEA